MENRALMATPQNPSANSIPRTSLTSVVAERLREKIVQGEIQEGEQLRQDAIAQEFAVSRIPVREALRQLEDRKSTRLNSSHVEISYAVFCLKKKNRCEPRQSVAAH